MAQKIVDTQKKAVFLSSVGSETFSLIQVLLAPKDICDQIIKFEHIAEIQHFERLNFIITSKKSINHLENG